MAKKKQKFKKFKRIYRTPEMRKRHERAKKAAIRQIAKQDGITIKEATKLYKKNALVEVLFTRPARYATRKFIEVSPGQFLEIPEGKPVRAIYAEGPVRNLSYVSRVRSMKQYWELVDLLASEYRISIQEARKKVSKRIKDGRSVKAIIWEETGESP